jgi:hypothetical protein
MRTIFIPRVSLRTDTPHAIEPVAPAVPPSEIFRRAYRHLNCSYMGLEMNPQHKASLKKGSL